MFIDACVLSQALAHSGISGICSLCQTFLYIHRYFSCVIDVILTTLIIHHHHLVEFTDG